MTYIALANEELVPRIERAITTLTELRATRKEAKEITRLTNKIDGLVIILNDQRERFQNMRTVRDAAILCDMIEITSNPEHEAAVKLVQGYLAEYYEE